MVYILIAIAAICNAVMDTLKDHLSVSVFKCYGGNQWINPAISWTNKYKAAEWISARTRLPFQAVRFLLGTCFVYLMDMWHMAKYMMLLFLSCAIYLGDINPVIAYLVFAITFELFYGYILIKR
jgi:hypothetical protein